MANYTIFSWNVNGYRACLKKGFTQWLQQESPDIICLQETRVLTEQISEEEQCPQGYHAVWHSAERKGYSGTAVFSKNKALKVTLGIGAKEFDCEGRCIEMDFGDFVLFNCYFPNGGRDLLRVPYKLKFYDRLLKKAKKLKKAGRNVLITGDWNTCHQEIDLARPKANHKSTGFLPEERKWVDTFIAAGFLDTFRDQYPEQEEAYSWWSQRGGAREKNIGWRLDYFLANEESLPYIRENIIHPTTKGSDHCPVELRWRS